jgi:hypothetical protein
VKVYKIVKVAKERRHATKTREKRGRRSQGMDSKYFVCGLDDQEESPDTDTPTHCPQVVVAVVVSTSVCSPVTLIETTTLSDYELFGGTLKLQLFDNFDAPPPGLEDVLISTTHMVDHTTRLNTPSVASSDSAPRTPPVDQGSPVSSATTTPQRQFCIPLLSFSQPSPNAKTIVFLQQEMDILSLLTFSGVIVNDIPLMFKEQYGTEICLPDSLTPEAMLLLSQRVCLFESNGEIICALKDQHEYSSQRKESIIFFIKQEFRLLSLLGATTGGLLQSQLTRLFEEKYEKNIMLPFGTTLLRLLHRSGRVACEVENGDVKYELIPYYFV